MGPCRPDAAIQREPMSRKKMEMVHETKALGLHVSNTQRMVTELAPIF